MTLTKTPTTTMPNPSQGEIAGRVIGWPVSTRAYSRVQNANRAIRKPNPIKATEVRIHARKVRSAAR